MYIHMNLLMTFILINYIAENTTETNFLSLNKLQIQNHEKI